MSVRSRAAGSIEDGKWMELLIILMYTSIISTLQKCIKANEITQKCNLEVDAIFQHVVYFDTP